MGDDVFEEFPPELELLLLLPSLLSESLFFMETIIPIMAPMRMRVTMAPIQMIFFRRPLLVGLVNDPADDGLGFSSTVSTSSGSEYEWRVGSG